MSDREEILSRIRASLTRSPSPERSPQRVEQRIQHPQPNLIPTRARIPHDEQVELFASMAVNQMMTLARIASDREITGAIVEYLSGQGLALSLKASPSPRLRALPWEEAGITVEYGPGRIEDRTSLTPAFCAVAETGSLVFVSSPETPPTLNFTPDTHLVVLDRSDIVGTMEDVWERLRKTYGAGRVPRTVNFVSSVSFSGDIERLVKGAHGPLRLHVLLNEGA